MITKNANTKNSMPQMSLFGLGTRPRYEHNYFFALSPDAEVCDQLGRVADDLRKNKGIDGSWIGRERYHLPLHRLGQFPDARSDLVSRALSAAGRMEAKSFDIGLDLFASLESKTGKFPCILASSVESRELNNFWQLLKNNLIAVRLGEHLDSNFKPHTTLLYSRQPVVEYPLGDPIRWRVRDFVLIDSLVGKSEHIELGRWSLQE